MTAGMSVKVTDKLDKVVSRFYDLLVANPLTTDFFKDPDVNALKRKQVWFFSSLLMETNQGTHDYMRQAHKGLVMKRKLTDEHFDALLECLVQALDESELTPDEAKTIVQSAEHLRDAVLYR